MIKSMTGYGKTLIQLPLKKITIELKSLNSKNIDINVRVPSYYREKELDIRKILGAELERGKVDFSIFIEDNGAEISSKINDSVVQEYMNQLKRLVKAEDLELLKMAIRLPDSLKSEREELDQQEWKQILEGILETINKINTYRIDEGLSLKTDFELRITNIENLLEETIAMDPDRM